MTDAGHVGLLPLRNEQFGRTEALELDAEARLGALTLDLGDHELAGADVGVGKPHAHPSPDDRRQIGVLLLAKQAGLHQRAGGDHPRHRAFDEARAGWGHLLGDGDV